MWFVIAWRGCVFLMCAASFYLLWKRYAQHKESWNTKTRDYWYGRVMWTIAGMAISVEGIIRQVPLRVSSVFVIAASVVTLTGLLRKGDWGGTDD